MKFMMIYIKTSNYFNTQIMLMSQYKYEKKKREMNGMEEDVKLPIIISCFPSAGSAACFVTCSNGWMGGKKIRSTLLSFCPRRSSPGEWKNREPNYGFQRVEFLEQLSMHSQFKGHSIYS